MTRPADVPPPIVQPGDQAWTHRPDTRSTRAAPVHGIASVALAQAGAC